MILVVKNMGVKCLLPLSPGHDRCAPVIQLVRPQINTLVRDQGFLPAVSVISNRPQ
jgi:hypothetical protein